MKNASPKLYPDRAPFPGIRTFEAEDAAIYFGRDDETRAVIERLDACRTQGGARLSCHDRRVRLRKNPCGPAQQNPQALQMDQVR
jgi:Novel STAND NTPase 1